MDDIDMRPEKRGQERHRIPSAVAHMAAMLAAAIALAGCGAESEAPEEEPRPIAWAVVEAASGETTRRLTGRVRAAQRTALSFEVPGVVEQVFVEPGERFEAGAPLASLGTRKLALALEQRESEMREAKASLAEAARDLARKRKLHEDQWIADAAMDAARATHEAAESRA